MTVYEALMRDGREKRERFEAAQSADEAAALTAPATPPEPAGFRTRYRSEPGMIGHYPWTYADQDRRRTDRPEHEYESLYTEWQVLAMLKAERERCAAIATRWGDTHSGYETVNACNAASKIARAIEGPNVRAKPGATVLRCDSA